MLRRVWACACRITNSAVRPLHALCEDDVPIEDVVKFVEKLLTIDASSHGFTGPKKSSLHPSSWSSRRQLCHLPVERAGAEA